MVFSGTWLVADSGGMAERDGGAGPYAGRERLWDVALSFAGAQRNYVGQVAAALKAREVRCFYDEDEQVRLWGTHLAEELPRIYAQESAAVVVFISADYAGPGWGRVERRAALARAVAEAGVYVLPARFDDSELPGLLPDVVTVDLRRYTPTQFAGLVADKVAGLAGSPRGGNGPPGRPAGRLLAEVRDPFVLEVHRPVQPEDAPPGLPVLPPYVPREHDEALGKVVRAAADGCSGIAVLVGGSSTGKTRACWETLALLRDQDPPWRLWHPIDPSRPDAVLAELAGVGQRTVVWLNEAQFYLDPAEAGLGERVAAGLRALLRDSGRAPVLVLATVWPRFWGALTARPVGGDDRHAQARELLVGQDISVPAAFTPAQMSQLARAADVRMVLAARSAPDGAVIQFLAGARELLARYRNAPPAAAALIDAAMDARRLGMGAGLPQAFLEAAAPGYLTDTQWDELGEDWLEQALAYTAVPCKGARGPLTRIRPRPARRVARNRGDQLASLAAGTGPLYRLADYLDQHGRTYRACQIPPAEFWSAAAAHAAPDDQAALGEAAHARGLYRDAVQLHKNAAASGNTRAVSYLCSPAVCLSADPRPVHWVITHVSLDDPRAVAALLGELREAGAQDQVTALLRRDPAAHASLGNPHAVALLLDRLREAGAQDQVTALLRRDPAAHAPLDKLPYVAVLLAELRRAGAYDQVTALAARAAARAPLDDPRAVAALLRELREAGAQDQVTVLLRRDPAAHAPLEYQYAVAALLRELRETGAQDQVTALLRRDPAARAPLDDPHAVAALLRELREAGAQDQVTVLLRRDPAARAPLEYQYAVAALLRELREAGAQDQVTALAGRAAAHAPLDDPHAVAALLRELREAGAQDQVTALAGRAAAHAPLDDPHAMAALLRELREAGAQDQVTALAGRAAAHAPLHNPRAVALLVDSMREAGAQDQVTVLLRRDPAAHAPLDDPRAVALLVDRLREAGAQDQVTALAARAAACAPLDDPHAVAALLRELREAGAQDQVTVLLRRDPAAHAPLDDPHAVALLVDSMREAGAQDQVTALAARAAAHAPLENQYAVARLVEALRAVSAQDQVTALATRLPEAGLFELFRELEDRENRFRFGREADGSPSRPWGWDDLD